MSGALEHHGNLMLGGMIFTRTGMFLQPGARPTFSMWQDAGLKLRNAWQAVHWWLGDWCNYGQGQFGEAYAQAVDATGFDVKTLRNDCWVCNKIETSRRRDNLSFGHHTEVAGLDVPEQERWLTRAVSEGWSQAQLRKAIAEWQREQRRQQAAREVAEASGAVSDPVAESGGIIAGAAHLFAGDFRAVCKALPENSIDLVFSDPLLGSLELRDVAKAAERVLKPGGSLLIYTANTELVMTAADLSMYLPYHWTLAVTFGSGSGVPGRGVFARWVPLLWFVKQYRRDVDTFVADWIDIPDPTEAALHLVEKLTVPGETVLDPVCATGNIVYAACRASRRAIGVDADPNNIDSLRRRLEPLGGI